MFLKQPVSSALQKSPLEASAPTNNEHAAQVVLPGPSACGLPRWQTRAPGCAAAMVQFFLWAKIVLALYLVDF
jgi:hypothetical protein